MAQHLSQIGARAEHPLALADLANRLLRGMPVPLHCGHPPILGDSDPQHADSNQGPTSHGHTARRLIRDDSVTPCVVGPSARQLPCQSDRQIRVGWPARSTAHPCRDRCADYRRADTAVTSGRFWRILGGRLGWTAMVGQATQQQARRTRCRNRGDRRRCRAANRRTGMRNIHRPDSRRTRGLGVSTRSSPSGRACPCVERCRSRN